MSLPYSYWCPAQLDCFDRSSLSWRDQLKAYQAVLIKAELEWSLLKKRQIAQSLPGLKEAAAVQMKSPRWQQRRVSASHLFSDASDYHNFLAHPLRLAFCD
jgi:hypothetical protein